MDIKEFATNFLENIHISVEIEGTNEEEELASSILEYIIDNGEINAPQICTFQKTRSRITAYDYNDEAESLDLFYLIKADSILGKINNNRIQQGFNYLSSFYNEAIDGRIFNNQTIEETDEIIEVAKLIKSSEGKINQLRLYVLTDGLTDPSAVPSSVEMDEGYIKEFNVWDMQRVYQQHNIRAGKEKVEIDFPTNYDTELQCLKMSDENPYIDAYLAIIPGITLAKIYKKYQQILLEKNVRTFLQFKGKVNKGIRKTLREEPDMFFSYNNGISTTASKIELKNDQGSLYITRLYDWQIVNGGQTTASISASLSDKSVDLTKVFVPMKVSVIRDSANDEAIVKAISTTANSQTAIKNSDFSANDPYLIDLETFSRNEWVPNGSNKPVSKWYFERTRGQYLDQLAQLSGYNETSFKREYPKSQKLTKTDIAKVETLWDQRPYDVCQGAEKNYKIFVAGIKQNKPSITSTYFKRVIAKYILFRTIDELVKEAQLGGYKSNMNAYIMSSISLLSKGKLDLAYIWEHQRVQQKIKELVVHLITIVWKHITSSNNGVSNVNEWTKKPECWNRLKIKLSDVERIPSDMLQKEEESNEAILNEAQQEKIKEAEEVPAETWFKISKWAKSKNLLTPIDRKAAFNFGAIRSRNQHFVSLKQAQYALRIRDKAIDEGFSEEE